MKTSRLYHQLHELLGQPIGWADQRHLQTLIWMVIGVVCSECISLPKWLALDGACGGRVVINASRPAALGSRLLTNVTLAQSRRV